MYIKICLAIGYPIKKSLSPVIHNAGYKMLGIDDRFQYTTKEVLTEQLESFLKEAKDGNIKGISVTMPHKEEAMKYLDEIDPVAEEIGAVNTVVNDNGKLIGYNTDWIGAVKALKSVTEVSGKKVALVGAGGAAKAIAYGIVKEGGKLKVYNRTVEKAKEIAEKFNAEFESIDNLEEIKNMDIIINSTSVGMGEDVNSPIPKVYLNNEQVIFDIVYSPMETKLIQDAKKVGAKVVYGYLLLLYQAAAQFELYTGQKAPVQEMKKALEETFSGH